MPQVAAELNRQGVAAENGEEWCRQSVKTILSNDLYVGDYEVAGYGESVSEYRLMSDELFEAVEDIRYRFRDSQSEMSAGRKQSKADRILSSYKSGFEQRGDDDF